MGEGDVDGKSDVGIVQGTTSTWTPPCESQAEGTWSERAIGKYAGEILDIIFELERKSPKLPRRVFS